MTANPAIQFFHVWDTYAKVVSGDYMFHRELSVAVSTAIRSRFADQAIRILDLGCGDAATFAPILQEFSIESYYGVDLSAAALELAEKNLAFLECSTQFQQADFVTALAKSPQQDVIYISFALHHLQTSEKAEFFYQAAKILSPGGLVLFVDVVREEGQTLKNYHRHYCDFVQQTMINLNKEERDAICAHISGNDYPDPRSVLSTLANEAGLKLVSSSVPQKWHQLIVFERP
jgi:ubiquinone/menaquinone biosynthesis C-methylase UbiE